MTTTQTRANLQPATDTARGAAAPPASRPMPIATGATSVGLSAARIAACGLLALATAMGIGRFAFTPLMPMMQSDAGLSLQQGSWLAAINYLGYLLGALAAIRVRGNPLRQVHFGLAGIALTTLGMALRHIDSLMGHGAPAPADAPPGTLMLAWWMLMRLLAGLASAWVLVFTSAWAIARLTALHRGAWAGWVFAGVGTGIAAAGLICLMLSRTGATSPWGWADLGLLATLTSLLVLTLSWRDLPAAAALQAPPQAAPAQAAAPPAQNPQPATHRLPPGAAALILCYGIFGLGYIVPATYLPVMARASMPDPAVFGWAWPVFGLAAALSTIVVSRWAGQASNRRVWAISHGIMALGCLAPTIAQGLPAIVLSALAVGGTFMVITMVGLREARLLGGARASSLIAAMTAAFALGQILGPLLVQQASRWFGSDAALAPVLWLATILLLTSGLWVARDGSRPAEAASPSPSTGTSA